MDIIKMKRIGINFVDNDFYNTFKPLMNLILKAYVYNPEKIEGLTKTQVVLLCNELVSGIYLLFQSGELDDLWDLEHTKKYLTIKEKHILFDEEVDTFIEERNYDMSFHWVDFDELQTFCV